MLANPAKSDLCLVGESVLAAADALGLSREELAGAIGVSIPTVARMKKGAPVPSHKPYELALQLIRLYRGLYSIVGGDQLSMKHWMKTPNQHLKPQGQPAVPAELIQSTEGLIQVLWYLDAMRGRI